MNGGVCIAHFNPDALVYGKINLTGCDLVIFLSILLNLYLVFIHPEEIPFIKY